MPFTIPGTQITIPDNVDPTQYILSLGAGVGQQLTGAGQPAAPAAPAAPADTSAANTARDTLIQQLAAQHGGQTGTQSTVYNKPTAAQTAAIDKITDPQKRAQAQADLQKSLDSGFDVYQFKDGYSVEVSPDGNTRNQKLPSATATKGGGWGTPQPIKSTDANGNEVTTYYGTDPADNQFKPIPGLPQSTTPKATQTPQDVAAQSGNLIIGTGANARIFTKDANSPTGYSETTQSQATQKLADDATTAKTALDQANTQKLQIDNALAADPQNQALKQQAQAADNALKDAQTKAQTAAANKTAFDQQAAAAKLGGEIAQTAATTAGTQATTQRTQQQIAQGNAPTIVGTAGSTERNILTRDPNTGAITSQPNPNYTQPGPSMLTTGTGRVEQYWDPATQSIQTRENPNWAPTDPGAMTAQLTQQTNAYAQQLQQKVASGQITGDQAQSQLNQYLSDIVEPQKADIAAAQAKAQSALQYQQAQTGYQQGLTAMLPADLAERASNDAQSRAVAMMPYMVNSSAASNPGFTLNSKGFPQINSQQIMANATFSLPNLQEIGRQGAAAALAQISPTAQMHAQTPGPPAQPPVGGLDINSMLNMNRYGGGGGMPPNMVGAGPRDLMSLGTAQNMVNTTGQPGGAQVGGQTQTPPPAAPPPVDWNALMQRQQQSAQEQGIQAQLFPVAGAPQQTPGMFNPAWQNQYPGMGAGMPATGPVAGDLTGTSVPWGWPPYQPAS